MSAHRPGTGTPADTRAPTLDRLLRQWAVTLHAVTAHPRLEVEQLAGHVLQCTRAHLYAHGERPLEAGQRAAIERLLARRARGEPLPYLTGLAGFRDLTLQVSPVTLIPRADTGTLVDAARAHGPVPGSPAQVLDLGTGSGAVALALAVECPHWTVTATDCSEAALAVARANARRLDLAGRIRFVAGDWFAAVDGCCFELIVSNPPYIAADDPHLADPALAAEPAAALVSGPDGLEALRVIIAGAPPHLAPGGALWVEHGHRQGAAVRGLLAAAGFEAIASVRDPGGHERASGGRLRVK